MNVYWVLHRLLVVAASICAFLWLSHSDAQAAITLSCPGNVSVVPIESFSWSASKIVVTKTSDASSPKVFQNAANLHTNLGTCMIEGDPDKPIIVGSVYNAVTLSNTQISGYKLLSGGTTETFTLTFTKIVQTNLVPKPTPTPAPTAPPLKSK